VVFALSIFAWRIVGAVASEVRIHRSRQRVAEIIRAAPSATVEETEAWDKTAAS
jgi:hypothetical protein